MGAGGFEDREGREVIPPCLQREAIPSTTEGVEWLQKKNGNTPSSQEDTMPVIMYMEELQLG